MGQVVQVNGDYNIKTGIGNNITLDTGPQVGSVIVTGNFIVKGSSLTVSADNLNVKDNVIVLNYGETGAGVTLRYSGIQVDRGTLQPASIIFDEASQTWLMAEGVAGGALNYSESKLKLKEILTNSDTDSGDLTLIGSGIGVVKVTGTSNYTGQVLSRNDDSVLANKGYVDYAIQNSPSFQITATDTRVIATDKDVSGSLNYLITQTGYSTFGESAVSILVDGVLSAQFYKNRVQIEGLEFNANEITNNLTNGDISLRTQGTGKVKTNYALELENIGVNPAAVSNAALIYSSPVSTGATGVFFANTTYRGELISKNKALVFSMIF